MVVFIGHASTQLEEIFALLEKWSEARATGDFCLVRVGSDPVTVHRVRAGAIEATTFGLAMAHLDLDEEAVNLVGVLPVAPGTGRDDDVSHHDSLRAINRWVEDAADVLPNDAMGQLLADLVLLPHDYDDRLETSCFVFPWRQVFLVVPEDRSGPNGPNLLAEQPERYAPHAAHSLLSLTGLIGPTRGLRAELFPTSLSKPAGETSALLSKNYSRILDVGPVANLIGDLVFSQDDAWRSPGPEFESLEDSVPKMRAAASVYLSEFDSTFGLSSFTPRVLEVDELTLMEAVREFFRVLVSFVRRLPSMVFHFIVGRVHDAIAVRLEKGFARLGDERLVQRYADRFAPPPAKQLEHKVDAPVNDADGAVKAAWDTFVELNLGAIDGTPMSNAALAEVFRRDRFTFVEPDPARVVPNPENVPPSVDGVEARACDPRALESELRKALLSEEAEDASPGAVESDATASEDAVPAGIEPPDDAVASPDSSDQEDTTADEKFDEEWVAPHRGTLAWLIGRRIADNMVVAKAEKLEEDEVLKVLDEQRSDENTDEEERKRLGAGFLKISVRKARLRSIALALVTAGAIVALGERRSVLTIALVCAVSVLVWLALMTRCVQWYTKQNELVIREQVQRWLGRQNQIDLGRIRASDFLRFGRLYSHYLEWAEIVGWMAHRPWLREQTNPTANPDIDESIIPAASTLAIPAGDEAFVGTANLIAGRLFTPSWLTSHYRATQYEIMREWGIEHGRLERDDPDAIVPDPALSSQAPDSELRELTRRLRRGDAINISAKRDDGSAGLAARLLRNINQLKLDQLVNEVETRPGSLGESFAFDRPSEFFAVLVEAGGEREVSARNFPRLSDDSSDIAETFPEMPDTGSMTVESLTGGVEIGAPLRVAIRMSEFTRQVNPSKLVLFSGISEDAGLEESSTVDFGEL